MSRSYYAFFTADFFIISVQEAEAQIQSAREFIQEIETVIKKLNIE